MAARKSSTTTTTNPVANLFLEPGTVVTGRRGKPVDKGTDIVLSGMIQAKRDTSAFKVTAQATDKGGTEYVIQGIQCDGKPVVISKSKALGWAKRNGRKLADFGLDNNGNLVISVPVAS